MSSDKAEVQNGWAGAGGRADTLKQGKNNEVVNVWVWAGVKLVLDQGRAVRIERGRGIRDVT